MGAPCEEQRESYGCNVEMVTSHRRSAGQRKGERWLALPWRTNRESRAGPAIRSVEKLATNRIYLPKSVLESFARKPRT